MSISTLHRSNVVAVLLMLMPSFAHAEVSTQGTPEVVHLVASNASIEEVLGALHDAYGLTWRSNISLENQISGTYDGRLPQVLGRLLDGSNFVLTNSGNTFHLVIVSSAGKSQTTSTPSVMPLPIPATEASPALQAPIGVVLPFAPRGPPIPFVPQRDQERVVR